MAEVETTFSDRGLKIYFVIKGGLSGIEDVSNDMNIAYTNIQEYFSTSESVKWLTESECLKLIELTKKDVFVLEEFNGVVFEYLKSTKSLIIGPRCLISCLIETSPIPPNKSPVFTTAMRNLYVCISGLSLAEKTKIRNLVYWMGGFYCDDLLSVCTHLVSNTVRSSKYEKAALSCKYIMHPNWVSDVWRKSQKENILATSKEFYEHKLPIFYNLNITSTGLSIDKRNNIKNLVTENGGKYDGRFQSKETDIVILEKDNTDSQKYKTAIEFRKECLLPSWITDSVRKGYALPLKNYRVRVMKVSTPTKSDGCISITDFNPNSTELSEISQFIDHPRSSCVINETCPNRTNSEIVFKPPVGQIGTKTYQEAISQLDSFNLRDIKEAGSFLDGCRIYLCGFSYDEKEKLNKILNSGDAIRYEEINENVTHIIVGESPNQFELQSIQNQTQLMGVVTLHWLLESFKLRQPADENNFLYRAELPVIKEPEAPSPSSKKTIESMNHSFKKPVLPRKLNLDLPEKNFKQRGKESDDDEEDLLQQYKLRNISSLPIKFPKSNPKANILPQPSRLTATTTFTHPTQSSASTFQNDSVTDGDETCTEDTDQYDFFEGLAIYVHETDDNLLKQLTIYCENAGGKVVSKLYKQVVDYVIVSSERPTDLKAIPVRGKNIVNTLWLEDAMYNNTLVEQKYFHNPIPSTADKKPLEGINIVISIYTANERVFLQSLILILGAKASEVYMKKERPLLICPSPEGAKYQAAVRWKNPVVNADWLVECAKLGKKVELYPYLVGEAIIDESWEQSQSKSNNEIQTSSEKSFGIQSKSKEVYVDVDKDDHLFIVPQNSDWKEGKEIKNIEKKNCDDLHMVDNVVLRHRRLSELTEQYSVGSNSAMIAPEDNPINISDFVTQFSTPNRQCIYEVCKEMENKETPPTQRLRKLIATPNKEKKKTPKISEFCTTPEVQKRRLEYFDRYYIPKKERRPSTPLSEIKKKFWKQALGEHYWEPEVRSQQTATDDDVFAIVTAATSSLLKIPQEEQHETSQSVGIATASTNEHIRLLDDFIKNRESGRIKEKYIYDNEDDNVGGAVFLQKFDSEMGGTEELIGWKDPSEFLPARRNTNRMRHQGVPKFSISCSNSELKQQIIEKIKSLQGQLCENLINYDETCTHIVCEKLNRGEKILSCIAAGKWILSLKYIEDSYDEGFFLDEEQYEWGNPKSSNLPALEQIEQTIAHAAFRWRIKLTNSIEKPLGVFSNFNCILHVAKKENFQRLITAGGGFVLNVKPPYSENTEALQATHCLVETKTTQLTRTDHIALKEAGVRVLSVMYLNAYLTSDVQPDCSKYMLSLDT